MFLPITVPFNDTGEHHGLFNTLNKHFGVDLLGEKYVDLTSSEKYTGEISTLVNHGTGHYQSKSASCDTFMQITFLKGFIFPTGYTLKGKNGHSYSKSWYVYGIHRGDENFKSKWDVLAINDTSQSTYCSPETSSINCGDTKVGSFKLKPQRSKKGYKHIRMQLKEGSNNNCPFLTEGIDFYGSILLSETLVCMRSICLHRYNKHYMIMIVVFSSS